MMAAGPSQSEPLASQELNGDFKKPGSPLPPAVRAKAPATNPSNPEEVKKEGPTVPPDYDSAEPEDPPALLDSGETRGPAEEQPRPPTAAPSPGGPARAPPYREPPWGGPATAPYSLETLKGGTILGTRSLKGMSCCLFGRLASCDVCLEHPSVSRYHAVLQHRVSGPEAECDGHGPGFYLYDLGSTHGTFLNKTRIPRRTYCRVHVGHVLRFGGSTRLFLFQGPEEDREAESELTVTQLKELRKQQQMMLEKKMLGEDSDEEEETDTAERKRNTSSQDDEMGCTWGMGEDAVEDEAEENPIVLEFQQEREAFYIKDPKKALQGFFDREGEELEYEFDEQGHSTWLCRVRLPVDDSTGKQLVAEAIHSGKKKEAMIQCSLEACRILDTLGLLRQEAVSRKRKAKNWEDEDFYDSDDDTFLDRTGLVEKKRLNRMKKAGKIDEKPETFESLVAKLNDAEKELSEISERLKASGTALSESPSQDSLDAFMSEMKSGNALDGVSRKKLHLRTFELRKEQQRLKGLIKIVKPAEIPELKKTESQATDGENKAKKLTLPLFGAMKGGSKFKLKTGTIGKLPPKRPELPPTLMRMKDEPEVEEEEEEEEEEEQEEKAKEEHEKKKMEAGSSRLQQEIEPEGAVQETGPPTDFTCSKETKNHENMSQLGRVEQNKGYQEISETAASCEEPSASKNEYEKRRDELKKKKAPGLGKLPLTLSSNYPEDDPDYCVWVPPEGQSGDGRTHLNDKYGY
ncbi:kanadaptin [Monodon monoceros]|uniref:Solute carrier family 4 member 1 adaptor protein n=1 Tax=Monodon monoceros TaxID=40151 RepID=A0A8C6AX30_MONMO|nr:kanadaptin [Monodon monoceros]